ncbi:MAG: ATP phosphoribosyltransferase [Candidatus Caenarcaniphilales bacterium]|nr:ATP phosphoribosyltransferase [Candidatus Caenarcaniphilales bacterium]
MLQKKNKYRIAIPKGALLDDSRKLLTKANISFEMQDRKLIFETSQKDVEILLVKPIDVPVYVENGAADVGIVGSDVLGEEEPKILTLLPFSFGYCELVVAVPKDGNIKKLSQIPDYCRVATKFPHLARRFFRQEGVPVEIIELNGSIEIAPLTGLSEVIVDLVATGRTLKDNGLVSLETISKHSARLIANRVSWQLNHQWIIEFMSLLTSKEINKE